MHSYKKEDIDFHSKTLFSAHMLLLDTDYKVDMYVITNLFGNKQFIAIVTERKSVTSRRLVICTNADTCRIDLKIISAKNAKAIVNVSKE